MKRSFCYRALNSTIARTRSQTGKRVLATLRDAGHSTSFCLAVENTRRLLGKLMAKRGRDGRLPLVLCRTELGLSRRTADAHLAALASVTTSEGKPLVSPDGGDVVMAGFWAAIGRHLADQQQRERERVRLAVRRHRCRKAGRNSQEDPAEIRAEIRNSLLLGDVTRVVESVDIREEPGTNTSDPPAAVENCFADEPASEEFPDYFQRPGETSTQYTERCLELERALRPPDPPPKPDGRELELSAQLSAWRFLPGLWTGSEPDLDTKLAAMHIARRKAQSWKNPAAAYAFALRKLVTGVWNPPSTLNRTYRPF